MTGAESFSKRSTIIKMDVVTEDIKRLCEGAPSGYEVAKKYLVEARAILMTNQKKALKLIKKAHSEIKQESVVATEYNAVRERIRFADDRKLEAAEAEYMRCISKGDYKGARKQVHKLVEGTRELGHPIKVAAYSKAENSIRFENTSNRSVVILLVRGVDGVHVNPASFALEPFGDKVVSCTGVDGCSTDITVEYQDSGVDRSFTTTVAFR